MKFSKLLIVASFLAITTSSFAGGGWTHPKGQGYFKLGQSFIRTNQFFDADANEIPITTFGLYMTSFYGEYGFTDKFTGIVSVPLAVRAVLNRTVSQNTGQTIVDGDQHTGIGDINLGFKYSLYKSEKFVLAGSLTLGLPAGTTTGGETQLLQTGDGEFNQLVQLHASTSFSDFFASTNVGVNNRTEGFSEEFRYGFELGYSKSRLTVIAKLNGIISFMNGTTAPTGGSIFSNNLEYTNISGEIAYTVYKNLGLSFSIQNPLGGRNVLNSTNYNVGLFYNLK